MRISGGLCVPNHDGQIVERTDDQALTFADSDGNPMVWVFPCPGRIWKDRWVAFTHGEAFKYWKGSREECIDWANSFTRGVIA
jgi:hypothetical protein